MPEEYGSHSRNQIYVRNMNDYCRTRLQVRGVHFSLHSHEVQRGSGVGVVNGTRQPEALSVVPLLKHNVLDLYNETSHKNVNYDFI